MDRDAKKMRGERPFVFTNIRAGNGVADIAAFIAKQGGLGRRTTVCFFKCRSSQTRPIVRHYSGPDGRQKHG